MGQLHQVIGVEGKLEGIAKALMDETTKTFGKSEHFMGAVQRHEMFDADAPVLAPTYKELVTTVPEKLDYLAEGVIRYYDAFLQKEATNQVAKADLVVDGVAILKEAPATFLLGLENKLTHLRAVYLAAPTLQPGIAWDQDDQAALKGVYKARHQEEVFVAEKTTVPVVLYHATDKHPAQVKEVDKTVNTGKKIISRTCGMLTPARKSELLGRIDKLIQAAATARMEANNAQALNVTVGDAIFKYIHGA